MNGFRIVTTCFVGVVAIAMTSPALVQESKPLVSSGIGKMKFQMDSLAKDLARVGDTRMLAIYKDLVIQLSEECKVIYCDDNRKNYRDVSVIEQKAADSTLLFVRQGHMSAEPDGKTWSLPSAGAGLCTPTQIAEANKNRPANDQYQVERFYDEPAPGFCSGFKVGKDLIATAGHCVKSALDCQSIKLIANFRIDSATASPVKGITADRIFACKEVVGRSDSPDWAVIRVDRELTNVPKVSLRQTGTPAVNAIMTVIGYPMGLPVKIAGEANVRTVNTHDFVTAADTYGGNSGSPVFDSARLVQNELLVEGILVKGAADFVNYSQCRISNRCKSGQCNGETATLAQEFRSLAEQP